MNVLVTGGAGYVGSKLLERLVMNQKQEIFHGVSELVAYALKVKAGKS